MGKFLGLSLTAGKEKTERSAWCRLTLSIKGNLDYENGEILMNEKWGEFFKILGKFLGLSLTAGKEKGERAAWCRLTLSIKGNLDYENRERFQKIGEIPRAVSDSWLGG